MSGSNVVLSDAQMGMFKVLRPMPNFESVYQGQSGTIPIAFPGNLAPEAATPGFADQLLAGLAVPLGARLLVQIPMVIDLYTAMPDYNYQFIWRTRNQGSIAQAILSGRPAAAYHLRSEGPGRKEISSSGDNLVFIPASSDVEVFEQTEPSSGAALLNVKQQRYVPQVTPSWVQPLTPTGAAGIWQQGAYQFTMSAEQSGPSYVPLWLDSSGDEMMILVYKNDTTQTWDFSGLDQGFSNTYGTNDGGLPNNPNLGILVSSGTMGS